MPILFAQLIKYDPLLRLPEFVAGLVLFVVWRRLRLPVIPLGAFTAAMAVLLVLLEPFVAEPVMHNGLTVLAWGPLVLLGASLQGGPLAAVAFVFLGRISFALYLLHMPVYSMVGTFDRLALHGALTAMPWAAAGIATAVSLLGAVLVHLFVEEPARRWLLRATPLVWISAARIRLRPSRPGALVERPTE